MRKTGKRRSVIWSITGILCFLFAAIMLGMVGRTLISYWNSEKSMERMYQDMTQPAAEQAETPEQAAGSAEEAETSELPPEVSEAGWNASYDTLRTQNGDMVGWIHIPDTVIDYPVMHTPEAPNYYFHRDFYGKYSSYGMIYIDGACRLDESSPNLLLYGHHMRNGAMFASIEKYSSRDYWEQHPEIYFSTPQEDGVYEVMAAFRIQAGETGEAFMAMLAARTEEDYEKLIQYIDRHKIYQTGITAQWPEPLITLTTCEYTNEDGRFLVIAKKK